MRRVSERRKKTCVSDSWYSSCGALREEECRNHCAIRLPKWVGADEGHLTLNSRDNCFVKVSSLTSLRQLLGLKQYVPSNIASSRPLRRISPATCSISYRPSHREWINGKERYCSSKSMMKPSMGGIPQAAPASAMPHPPCIPELPLGFR